MRDDGQLERLAAFYAEKSDGELEKLYAGREDLTDVALQALIQVLRERDITPEAATLSGVPERGMSDLESSNPQLAEDEVCICTFDDAFRTKEALRLLDEQEIAVRVMDWNAAGTDHSAERLVLALAVVVHTVDEARATALLQDKLGIFLAPEGDDDFADEAD